MGGSAFRTSRRTTCHKLATKLGAIVHNESAAVGLPTPRLVVEPGRAIAGPGTITLYRVGTVKDVAVSPTANRRYVSVDGGMSDNIRTSLYGAEYDVRLISRTSDAAPALGRIVGKHCESGDIVVRDAWVSDDVQPGDLLGVAAPLHPARPPGGGGRPPGGGPPDSAPGDGRRSAQSGSEVRDERPEDERE